MLDRDAAPGIDAPHTNVYGTISAVLQQLACRAVIGPWQHSDGSATAMFWPDESISVYVDDADRRVYHYTYLYFTPEEKQARGVCTIRPKKTE